MKRNVALMLVMSSLVFLPACKPWQWVKDKLGMNKGASHDNEATKMADALVREGDVLVSMDGKPVISTKSLEHEFAQLLIENPQLQAVLPMMPEAKTNFLQGMISQALVDRYVAEKGIDQKADYQRELARMEHSIRRMLNTKYFSQEHAVEVSDADVEKFYEDNKKSMAELMLSRGGTKAAAVMFDREDAARAFAVKAKGRDLARVAKESGVADRVRDFNFVNDQSLGIDANVKNKVVSMTKVPAVEVVKGTDKHFWVVQATEKQEQKYRPIDQVRAGLKQYIEKERRMAMFDKEIAKLRAEYHVVVNDDALKAQRVAEQAPVAPEAAQSAQAPVAAESATKVA